MNNESGLRNGRRIASGLIALMAATMLTACDSKAPAGQVVATVDGEEITKRDLLAELDAANAPANIDIKKVQNELLARVIARKLAVKEAKKEGIDKTPEYISIQQRQTEMLLAGQLADRWASKVTPPTDEAVKTFILANPQMFAARKILALDQIRTSPEGINPKDLVPLNSNDAVSAYLQGKKKPFQRVQASLDTLTLPKKAYDEIASLPPGMPFAVNQQGALILSAVIGAREAPVPDAEQVKIAKAAMQQQALRETGEGQLNSLRSVAKIEYQPGYAAPAKAPAGAPAS